MPRYEETDRAYHGIQRYEHPSHTQEWEPSRLLVEQTEFGPTEHRRAVVLRELQEPEGGFGWGYDGSGTSRTAAAILADALNEDYEQLISTSAHNDIYGRLREDFCEDMLSQMCDEFRLRRGAVLRWVRGWYAQHGIAELPTAVATLPPVDAMH